MTLFLDHIAINMIHEAEMLRFYRDTLAFPPERMDAYRSGNVPFPSFRLTPDTIIDLFPKAMWKTMPEGGTDRFNHFCYALDKQNWDALQQRLKEAAIAIEEGPVERWGAHGDAISVYFRDPDGNLIEARYYPEDQKSEVS